MSEQIEGAGQGLTKRAVRAGVSLAFLSGTENLLALTRTLILARLLDPREFGVMGIALIAAAAAEAITQTGLAPAMVQRRDDPRPYLGTVFVVGAARGAAITAGLLLAAPLIGWFFRSPGSVPVLRAVAFVFLLRGLMNPAWFLLERELRLTRLALPRTIGLAADLALTAVLAFTLRSVWAMVWGYLFGVAVALAGTYAVRPHLPRPAFDRDRFRALRSFGRHVFRNEFLTFITREGDKAVVGRVLEVTSLGLYSFAFRMATLPALAVGNVCLRVVFPSFARIQNEPERLRHAFQRLLGLVAAGSLPMSIGLLLAAPEIVSVVFGPRWVEATMAFRILSLAGAASILELACGAVASSLGRPDLAARASLFKLSIMGILLLALTHPLGIEGAALAVLAGAAVSSAYLVGSSAALAGIGAAGVARSFVTPLLGCLAMSAAIGIARVWTGWMWPPAGLGMLIVAGAASYAVTVFLMDRVSGAPLRAAVHGVLRSF